MIKPIIARMPPPNFIIITDRPVGCPGETKARIAVAAPPSQLVGCSAMKILSW